MEISAAIGSGGRAPRHLALAALALIAATEAALAASEAPASYPTKQVRLVVAQGTGSATREQLERQGAEPMTSTPEAMLAHIDAEYGRFAQAIKLADLKVQ